MPLPVADGRPTLFILKEAFERAGLTRAAIDRRLLLTDEEFRVEGGLIAVGPVHDEDALSEMIGELETLGLAYYDEFFELSGNWPEWLALFAMRNTSAG